MTSQKEYTIQEGKKINIIQSTQDTPSIRIQTIIMPLKEGSQIIKFN